MGKKILKKFIYCCIIISFINLTCQGMFLNIKYTVKGTSTPIIYVDDDNTKGPWTGAIKSPYQFISQALENSTNDCNIYVFNGTYYENLVIEKQINLIGEDKKYTIIDGNYQNTVVQINYDSVTIQGFTIKNSQGENDDSGIKIVSNNITISDCIILRTRKGVVLEKSCNNRIINTLFYLNGEGIYQKESTNCHIINCELCHNAIGINLRKCDNITIINSYIHEQGIGLLSNCSSNIRISHCAICDNNNNQGGCFFFHSEDIDIYNSNFLHNGVGLRFENSSQILVNRCTFQFQGHDCIYVRGESEDILVTKSNIIENLRYGILLKNGECTLSQNNIRNNWIDGVHILNGECNARFNWWGTKAGPWIDGIIILDRLKINNGKLKVVPWLYKPVVKSGADWEVDDVFSKTVMKGYEDDTIDLPGDDTDGDGLPDWWECHWGYNPLIAEDHMNIDTDDDALNNFEECYMHAFGANPYHKDVFFEIDWMDTARQNGILNLPNERLIQRVQKIFSEHDIALHVDVGQFGGGEKIPYKPRFNYDTLIDLYWDYFLHNDLKNPRKNIFHYCLICDEGPGAGFEFIGWAHCNALCISSEILKIVYPQYDYQWLIISGMLHEFGHTFGLFSDDFGGNDNRGSIEPWSRDYWVYHNYKSVMNYRYTWKILDYSDGDNGYGDFDDWQNLDFHFFKNTNFDYPPT